MDSILEYALCVESEMGRRLSSCGVDGVFGWVGDIVHHNVVVARGISSEVVVAGKN
jgi:hypothetical protein